jgi:hypothetical protein
MNKHSLVEQTVLLRHAQTATATHCKNIRVSLTQLQLVPMVWRPTAAMRSRTETKANYGAE